jgi:hypothetical protein
MGRHRGPGRPKGSTSKRIARQNYGALATVDPVVRNQIIAIILIVLAFIILVSAVGFGGNLGIYLNKYMRLAFGWTTFIIPFILIGISYSLFKPDEYEITALTVIALTTLIATFSGMFHIFLSTSQATIAAQSGEWGGYLGFYIQKLFLMILNAPVSFVILLAFAVASALLATNTPISGFFHKKDKDGEKVSKNDIKIHETGGVARTNLASTGYDHH